MSKKLKQAALLGTAATVMAAALWQSGWLNQFEYATWTWRVRSLWKPSPATDRIKVILIDQESLDWAAKENALSWPWMRQAYNPVIDFCRRAGARAIAFDMLYSEASGSGVEDDATFGAKIGEKKDFIMAFFLGAKAAQATNWPAVMPRPAWQFHGDHGGWPSVHGASFPVVPVATNAAMLAQVAEEPDDDGVYRRVTPVRFFDGQPVPMLGLAAWLTAQPEEERSVAARSSSLDAGAASIPLDASRRTILRFRGPHGAHECLTAAAVIRSELQLQAGEKPQIDPAGLKDCFVFFGVSAPALMDLKSTPAGGSYPGVEVHATFLDNLLEGDFLRDVPRAAALVVALFVALAGAGTILRCRNGGQAAATFAAFLLIPPALGFGLYDRGFWWPMVFTWLAVALALTGAVILSYATEGRQKRFIKSAFRQYLSGDVIEQMLDNPAKLQLGGEKKELTMFFSDLKGFSTFSEKLEPQELTSLMNDVLSDACDVIFEEGGTVDKFIGDAIVAFWNAPVSQADHALRAVHAAVRCQRRLAERADEFKARAQGLPVVMRIGLNSGEVVVGNMGSRQRFNYTMLGDAANLASRLEGANKPFGTHLMVAESTWRQLNDAVPGREIGLVRVVGRATPVRVFEPLGLPGEKAPPEMVLYAKALQCVRERQWADAYELFADVGNDPLAEKYASQCLALRDGRLPDWDGVWNLTEK